MFKSAAELAYYVRIDRIFCIITGILFSIGVSANLWVLARIWRVLSSASSESTSSSSKHVLVYVGALAMTDLCLLFNCPFLIHDVTYMQWNFGAFLCKCVYGNESFNKLMSGFLLAALSFDQLITVRKILPPKWRSVSTAAKMIGILTFSSTILLIPVFIYTRVFRLQDEVQPGVDDDSIDGRLGTNLTIRAIHKCVFAPPPDMMRMADGFMLSMFAVGFCLPTVCIGLSYGTILYRFVASGYLGCGGAEDGDGGGGGGEGRRIRRRRRRRSSRRLLTWYILLLVVIYLACWTPYWTSAVRVSVAPQYFHDPQQYNHLVITYALLYIHLLPYLNAVLNAFAYGCMINFSVGGGSRRRCRRSISRDEENMNEPMADEGGGGGLHQRPVKISLTNRPYTRGGETIRPMASSRFSLGETWRLDDSIDNNDKQRSTPILVNIRKWPSSIEVAN